MENSMLPPKKHLRALLYARSAYEANPGPASSVNRQLHQLRTFLEVQGWVNQGEYIDEGISGLTTKRPGLLALLDECKSGYTDVVVVTDVCRIARNLALCLEFIEKLKALGVRTEIISWGGAISFSSVLTSIKSGSNHQTVVQDHDIETEESERTVGG